MEENLIKASIKKVPPAFTTTYSEKHENNPTQKAQIENLSQEQLSKNILDIFKDHITKNYIGKLSPDDLIKTTETIMLRDPESTNDMSSVNNTLNFEVTSTIGKINEEYEKKLKEAILNLNPKNAYNIHSWKTDSGIFDKKEKEITDKTPYKGFFDGYLISEGHLN
ncbi:MAG: hypothetical protein WCX46_00545 [Candidatus Paceibacterota bacterium]